MTVAVRAITLVLALSAAAGCADGERERRRRMAGEAPSRAALARIASASAGAALFGRCAACHTIARGGPDRNGPNLFGVMGQPVAGNRPRFGYTAALQRVGGRWTDETMDAWLSRPADIAPGTSMRFAGIPDPLDRADLIAYLKAQR